VLRSARDALSLSQRQLGRLVHVSGRVIARWENGEKLPATTQALALYDALEASPVHLRVELATRLGIELIPEDDPAPEAPPPPPPPPPHPRARRDGILFASAEARDVLPRHLRGFAVELLEGVERLGLTAMQAAVILARKETPPKK
jgi:transcriptional regulator with XRE-family HTH domain